MLLMVSMIRLRKWVIDMIQNTRLIKKWVWCVACMTVLSAWAGGRISVDTADYLLLTRETLPHMQILIQAALDDMDVEQESYVSVKRRNQRAALFPKLRIQASYTEDATPQYGYVEDWQTWVRTDVNSSAQNIDRYDQTGNWDNRWGYGASLNWDLTRLVWSLEESQRAQQQSRLTSTKRRRIADVGKRYAVLAASLPADADAGGVDAGEIVTVLQNAIYLDQMCGNIISDTLMNLKRREKQAEILEQERAVALEQERAEALEQERAVALEQERAEALEQERAEILELIKK
jgi:hypothetical protein